MDIVCVPGAGKGMNEPMNNSATKQPLWIRAAVNSESFAYEQAVFSKIWSFVGLSSDIPCDGDWFTTIVGGRSIFVQRFGSELRCFENRCAHRFYPLRTAERGNGPIVCGFHHWRYNKDGRAMGIPMCPELYEGAIPRDLDLGIPRLDLELCGELIFVRFPSEGESESLSEFLAEGFPILAAMSRHKTAPRRFRLSIAANWKFSHHISLDDYHIVAVHPTTFGKSGHLKAHRVKYYRFGRHSSFLATERDDGWDKMKQIKDTQDYEPSHYAILNVFPNTVISVARAVRLYGAENWYVTITRYVAVCESRSEAHVWMFKAPFKQTETFLSGLFRLPTDWIVAPIAARVLRKIMREDNEICEGQQRLAHQVDAEQNLSAYERRIAWFEESYSEALEPDRPNQGRAKPQL